jgi:hypothetical protein
MNGKRAKRLRRAALVYIVTKMKAKASEGYNEYNQAMNRFDWAPVVDAEGFPIKDPEGLGLKKPEKAPGTITCAWKWRVMYQSMKKRWMDRLKK